MNRFILKPRKKIAQYLICVIAVLIVVVVCFSFSSLIGYRVTALLLLMTVSILAMLFDIVPVLLAATLSALLWNYFFIPPIFTFGIDNTDDALLFLMYFVIALLNGVLSVKIREAEKRARDKEEKENTITLYNTLLHSLSHEMRTPLSTIIGAVDTLKENKNKLSSITENELLDEMSTAGIRLNRQVENLLNMSRLETGVLQLKRDWCDVNELIFSVIQKVNDSKQSHHLIFEANETLPFFKIDVGLMENALYNILHNAIQYTPHGSRIQFQVAHKNEELLITISDNGGGFSSTEIPLVFDKFYRVPNSKAGGTGLGLSIVKGFVEAHHGSIHLSNNAEGGATFTLIIPAETSFINQLKNE